MSAFILRIAKCIALAMPAFLLPIQANAERFTAGTVMLKMGKDERFGFVAGIVEGLAVSRYMQDGKKPEGMKCIFDWFYDNPNTVQNIYTAFERFPDYPPGSVVDAMARKACSQ